MPGILARRSALRPGFSGIPREGSFRTSSKPPVDDPAQKAVRTAEKSAMATLNSSNHLIPVRGQASDSET